MISALFIFEVGWNFDRIAQPANLFNILFLGFGDSALCFVTCNMAVKFLGAVKTSAYIYIVPVITVTTSVIILNERITHLAVCGTLFTIAGLFISENRIKSGNKGALICVVLLAADIIYAGFTGRL